MSDERTDPTLLPVTEAMVQFDMREGSEWNKSEIKRLVRALEANYGEREVVQGKQVLRDEVGQRLAQLGERMCAVHRMRPYTGWPELRERALQMLAMMEKTRAKAEEDLDSLWVRTHTRIEIHRQESFELSEYLTHHADWREGPRHKRSTVLVRATEAFWFEDTNMIAYHKTTLDPVPEQSGRFTLNIAIDLLQPIPAKGDLSILELLDLAEDRMRELFDDTFTDGARKALDTALEEDLA